MELHKDVKFIFTLVFLCSCFGTYLCVPTTVVSDLDNETVLHQDKNPTENCTKSEAENKDCQNGGTCFVLAVGNTRDYGCQ